MGKRFSVLLFRRYRPLAPTSFFYKGYRLSFLGDKCLGRGVNHPSLPSTKVNYEWSRVQRRVSSGAYFPGAHTNTIHRTWRSVKAFFGHYNREEDCEFHLAHYMFAAKCKAKRIPPYLQFLHLVANTHSSLCTLPRNERAT